MKNLFSLSLIAIVLFAIGCTKIRSFTDSDGTTIVTPFASKADYDPPVNPFALMYFKMPMTDQDSLYVKTHYSFIYEQYYPKTTKIN